MKIKLLKFITPPSIYNGYFTRKTFWEEKFTVGEFTPVNMKNGGCRNARKRRDIKDSDTYITLAISLKFGSLEKMIITSSDPKDCLILLIKGLSTSLGIKANIRPKKYKKARYAIGSVGMKELSKIIREFEKLTYKGYVLNPLTVTYT